MQFVLIPGVNSAERHVHHLAVVCHREKGVNGMVFLHGFLQTQEI